MMLLNQKNRIGNMSQVGSWEIILFESSAPSSRAFSKGKRYGWKYKKVNGFRKQIKKRGKKCYKGTGKCLND